MRLLHVINTMNPASGGTAEAVRLSLQNVAARQAVATLDRSTDPWMARLASETHCFGPGRGRYGYSSGMKRWLAENARGFDAVIVHGLWQHHGAASRQACRWAGVPYFVYPHGMMDPYFHRNAPFKRLKKAAYWPVEGAVLRDAAAVLFTAEEEKELAHATFDLRCNARIVPLGVAAPNIDPNDAEAFLDRHPEARGKRSILFLGRLHPKKGIEHLIEAFAFHQREDLHLILAGPEEDLAHAEALKQATVRHRITKKVTFTGLITGRLKAGALQTAAVFALPSHQENFGIAIAEALAFGAPVLISNKVNIWREIEQDGAGWAGPDDTGGMTELLGRWLRLSELERARMSANARACFEGRYRAEVAAAKLVETLRACGAGPK